MTLTAEQRAAISRENGKKSKGPVTELGKSRSRANALTHGLRAEVLPLPNEDPAKVAEREAAWNDYYQPQSPAAQHLVTECVRATLLADRAHAFHAAALGDQVRQAEVDFDAEQDDRVQRLKELLPIDDDPASVVRLLERTAGGCRWLLARWQDLNEVLRRQGFWSTANTHEALRLRGSDPKPEALKNDPDGYLMMLFNQAAADVPGGVALAALCDRNRMPQALWPDYGRGHVPDPPTCRAALELIVEEEVRRLRAREARLRQEIEGPARAEASLRALILRDEAEARRFLRYHAESRTAFHRAYSQLLKTLERDAAEGPAASGAPTEPGAAASSPNEPAAPAAESPPPDPEPDASPNEPSAAPAVGPARGASMAPPEPAVLTQGICGVDAVAEPGRRGAA
jgi:hypothetical protein